MEDQAAGPLPSKKVQFRLRIREPLTREPPARESPSAEPRPAARGNTTRGCDERVGVLTGSPVAGGAWGLRPRKAPLGARAQSAVVAVVPIVTRYADSTPCRVCPSPYGRLLTRKGVRPHFKRLSPSTSHTTPLRTLTSTPENGSRCAAQRAGGRLAVY
jgi:hypothetical protein